MSHYVGPNRTTTWCGLPDDGHRIVVGGIEYLSCPRCALALVQALGRVLLAPRLETWAPGEIAVDVPAVDGIGVHRVWVRADDAGRIQTRPR